MFNDVNTPLSVRIIGVALGALAGLFMLFLMSWTILDLIVFNGGIQ